MAGSITGLNVSFNSKFINIMLLSGATLGWLVKRNKVKSITQHSSWPHNGAPKFKLYLSEVMRRYLILFLIFYGSLAHANEITLAVDDCGPLGREGLGVVFSPKPRKQGLYYFAKGHAKDVCPKLLNASKVVGYEEGYCKSHIPLDPKECGYLKVFVITEYINE